MAQNTTPRTDVRKARCTAETDLGRDEVLQRIVRMGATLTRHPYDGSWYATCQGPEWPGGLSLHSDHRDTPEIAVAVLYEVWIAAGSPAPRLYTSKDATAINAWCESERALIRSARERGDVRPCPWRDREVSHG